MSAPISMVKNRLSRIARANLAILESEILAVLTDFSPTVVSTIHAGLDIESSDIDIVCTYQSLFDLKEKFEKTYQHKPGFFLEVREDRLIGRFVQGGFGIEVWASETPVNQQWAFRHHQVMKRLSTLGGPVFREAVRSLKKRGEKTQPAIASLLCLQGDPYEAILELEEWPDRKIREHLIQYNVSSEQEG